MNSLIKVNGGADVAQRRILKDNQFKLFKRAEYYTVVLVIRLNLIAAN